MKNKKIVTQVTIPENTMYYNYIVNVQKKTGHSFSSIIRSLAYDQIDNEIKNDKRIDKILSILENKTYEVKEEVKEDYDNNLKLLGY